MNMIEKMVMAIIKADAQLVEDEVPPTSQRWAEGIATACLTALSEPSEEMLRAGGMRTGEQWKAMIQSAQEG